ncbi:MAG TPA: hypothetical protein VN361_08230 [Oxalicibacterium sp.]|nr:hypothetical protein [Oxalicibacterium sp.]
MQLAYRNSTTCVATAACVTATGGLLVLAETGWGSDALSTIAALLTGIPWSLAFRWQPGLVWTSVLCTLAAVALNVWLLWRFGGRLPR